MKPPRPALHLLRILALGLTAVQPGRGAQRADTILSSPHNLSVSGPGEVRAQSEADVCGFCHTSHRSGMMGPLWNRYESVGAYVPYTSSTSKASPGQPTGSSKLCLSCHDGTVALGMVRNRPGRSILTAGNDKPITMARGVTKMPPGPSMLGKDLSDDHPISFQYDASLAKRNGELRPPSSLQKNVKLDANGEMQCTSCHDPHISRFSKFLVMDNTRGELCLECHEPDYWDSAIHNTDISTWNGKGLDPWPASEYNNVRDNACANCHQTHTAGTPERLLTYSEQVDTCVVCHSGNVAGKNIEREVRKPSAHNVYSSARVHDPAENIADSPRHVECSDCHNPHAAQAGERGTATLSGTLLNVPGVTSEGSTIQSIQQESELCYRCHGDYPHTQAPLVSRQFHETSVRRQFLAINTSFHPVESEGRNPEVPSLKNNLSESSLVSCTDCHNNDQGPGAGGKGPGGPHGSIYKPLLERRLEIKDGLKESASTYALCYKCHDRNSILKNESFPGHSQHVQDAKIACTTCHDPHGVQGAANLINFNLREVTPFNGRIEYNDNGGDGATCTLVCHGQEHDATGYDALGQPPAPLLPLSPESLP